MNKINKVHGQQSANDIQKKTAALDLALRQAQSSPQSQIKNTNPQQPVQADSTSQPSVMTQSQNQNSGNEAGTAQVNTNAQLQQTTQATQATQNPTEQTTQNTQNTQNTQVQNSTPSYSYDSNTDYSALINAAVAAGNYQQAAIYEQQRNAKIAAENLAYEQTNKYVDYLPGGAKYGTIQTTPNDMSPLINQMYEQEAQRLQTELNYETQSSVDQLNRALQDAQPTYEAAIANQLLETKQAQDAQALRNQVNGDRGGIGSAQVSSIGNTGAKNRELIAQEQRQLATDTARQIADLRAQGKYQEANLVLQNSQQRLAALYDEQVRLQQQQASQNELLSSLGVELLEAGQVPPDSILAAMGLDRATAQSYADLINAKTTYSSSSGNDDFVFEAVTSVTPKTVAAEILNRLYDTDVSVLQSENGREESISTVLAAYDRGSITLAEAVYILSKFGIGTNTEDFAKSLYETWEEVYGG